MSRCSSSSSHLFPPSIFTTFFPSHLFLTIAKIGNEERKIRFCWCERDGVPEWEREKRENEMKGKNLIIYHSQIHCCCYSFLSFLQDIRLTYFLHPTITCLLVDEEKLIFFFPLHKKEMKFVLLIDIKKVYKMKN